MEATIPTRVGPISEELFASLFILAERNPKDDHLWVVPSPFDTAIQALRLSGLIKYADGYGHAFDDHVRQCGLTHTLQVYAVDEGMLYVHQTRLWPVWKLYRQQRAYAGLTFYEFLTKLGWTIGKPIKGRFLNIKPPKRTDSQPRQS